ncbi:MAG: hypothetical protein ABIF04_02455 [Chloroflexota bacterium]
MSDPSGNQKLSLLEILFCLFFKSQSSSESVTPEQPAALPDNTNEPVRIMTSRVLLVIYEPIVDKSSGTKLSEFMNWNRPDDLVNAFIQEIQEASNGLARYQIVQRVELNEFPAKIDGYRYDPQTYFEVMKGSQSPHQPDEVDYKAILTGLNVLSRIASHNIDEVWLFGFPYAGFYESTIGGAGAFWCNSQPLIWTSGCSRRFVVMGFSYEREVGEMLHSFGHRTESILAQTFHSQNFLAWVYDSNRLPATVESDLNLFEQFLCFDQIAPGRAAVGTIHNAPNSEKDYDYNNPRKVPSNCDQWYSFPVLKEGTREVNADEWGNGEMRLIHKWWLEHLPKVAGRTSGVVNNWWQYIMDPNLVNM